MIGPGEEPLRGGRTLDSMTNDGAVTSRLINRFGKGVVLVAAVMVSLPLSSCTSNSGSASPSTTTATSVPLTSITLTTANIKSMLLTPADMPAGWTVHHGYEGEIASIASNCAYLGRFLHKLLIKAQESYGKTPSGSPTWIEGLTPVSATNAVSVLTAITYEMNTGCATKGLLDPRLVTIARPSSPAAKKRRSPVLFPGVGDQSQAWILSGRGVTVYIVYAWFGLTLEFAGRPTG